MLLRPKARISCECGEHRHRFVRLNMPLKLRSGALLLGPPRCPKFHDGGLCLWVRLVVSHKAEIAAGSSRDRGRKAFSSVPRVSGQLGRLSLIELHLGIWPRSRFVGSREIVPSIPLQKWGLHGPFLAIFVLHLRTLTTPVSGRRCASAQIC